MVLPPSLVSTYQRYKRDTDAVAAWLASTAKSLGFSTESLSSVTPPTGKPAGGGRLKGKARAKAKKQAASSSASSASASGAKQTPPPTDPKHIIAIKDFVSLADYVASKSAAVPEAFRNTIDRVIAARSGFGSELEQHGRDLDKGSDARHQHFVGVLEKVRGTLKPFMPATEAKASQKPADNLNNRFSSLSVYEPSQEFLDAPDIERPTKAANDNVTYEAEAQTGFEDAIFAVTTLVNDANRARSHISSIWSNYKDGHFDLAAAAVGTNTAIELVRSMAEDILPLMERHGGLGRMLEKFYMFQCLIKGWTVNDLTKAGKDNFNYDTWDIASGTFLGAYRLLDGFSAVLHPGELPLYKEGIYGYYDRSTEWSSKSPVNKFADDRALLMPFFSEMMTAIRGVQNWPVQDEFLRGMQELNDTGRISFYTVFAAQVFLDTTYTLGPQIESGFHTMVEQTNFMVKDIKSHFEFHKKLRIDNWPASNDTWLRDLQQSIEWIGKDPIRGVQTRMYLRMGAPAPDTTGNRIFRMSPTLSGLILYHFRHRYREAGLNLANAWGSIQYCRHLYNALHQRHLLEDRWPDMDVLYANLGEESFYVGSEEPQTPEDCFKKFALQMGTSAAAMSKGRRKVTPLASKAGPRGLKERSPVSSMFRSRYVEGGSNVQFTPENVSQIIELSLFEEEGNEEEGTFSMGQIDDPEKLKAKKKKLHEQLNPRQAHKKAASTRTLPPEDLIKPLMLALHLEMIEFSFPYLSMHRLCWRLLRAVKESCDMILRQLYTPAYITDESQLPWVVGWILMAGSGMEGGIVNNEPLQMAALAIEAFLDTGAGNFIITKVMGERFGMPIEFEQEAE